jgi:hypothetical protein
LRASTLELNRTALLSVGPRLPRIQEKYQKTLEPKALIIVDGSAHAQFLFQRDQAERVIQEILRLLSAK